MWTGENCTKCLFIDKSTFNLFVTDGKHYVCCQIGKDRTKHVVKSPGRTDVPRNHSRLSGSVAVCSCSGVQWPCVPCSVLTLCVSPSPVSPSSSCFYGWRDPSCLQPWYFLFGTCLGSRLLPVISRPLVCLLILSGYVCDVCKVFRHLCFSTPC